MVLAITSYQWFLSFHILGAALWVGAGFALTVLFSRLKPGGDQAETVALLRGAGFMGDRVFAPLSLIVGVLGFILVSKGDWEWKAWLIIAVAGWLLAAAHGGAVLGRRHGPLAEALQRDGWTEQATNDFRSYILHGRIALLIVVIVLLDMTLKPGL